MCAHQYMWSVCFVFGAVALCVLGVEGLGAVRLEGLLHPRPSTLAIIAHARALERIKKGILKEL